MNKVVTIINIILLLIFSFVILNIKDYRVTVFLLFILFIVFQLLKEKNKLNHHLIAFLPVIIITFLFQLIFNKQSTFMSNVFFSYLIFSKVAIISALVLLFVTVTSPANIISAFWFLSDDLRLILTMTFYFIPVIFDETKHISMVQKSRGLRSFFANPFPLIVPLLHRVMKRAEALSLTIASRGYDNH